MLYPYIFINKDYIITITETEDFIFLDISWLQAKKVCVSLIQK